MLINLKAIFQKVLTFFGYWNFGGELDSISVKVHDTSFVVIPSSRNISEQHLVINYGHRPNIALICIRLVQDYLGIHVSRGSSLEIHSLARLANLAKPEISNLENIVIDKCIFRFQISVHKMMFLHFLHSE